MSLRLMPERYLSSFADVSAPDLAARGIRCLILDVDNTLEPYENALPGEAVREWIDSLRAAGVTPFIVSNNRKARIGVFAEALGVPYICHAAKPFPFAVRRAMRRVGVIPWETLALGDQIFTDVLAAHLAGVDVWLVPPIRDKRDLLTRAKRRLERPVLRRYEKKMR